MDSATKLMIAFTGLLALFTFLLFLVTLRYTRITKKLLEQSEAAFKQSRTAFLIDVVDRMTEYVNQSIDSIGVAAVVGHCIGKLSAIDKIDKKASKEIWQILKAWGSGTKGSSKRKYKEFVDKYEELYRKEGMTS